MRLTRPTRLTTRASLIGRALLARLPWPAWGIYRLRDADGAWLYDAAGHRLYVPTRASLTWPAWGIYRLRDADGAWLYDAAGQRLYVLG